MSSRGRPRGSRTREYVTVRERPPKCPACGGTNRKVLKGYSPQFFEHKTAEYDRIVWRMMQCECGQLIRVAFEESENKTNVVS